MPDSVQLSTIEELRGQFDRGCLVACRYRPRPELPTVPRLVREITPDGLILLFGVEGRAASIDSPWVERWEAYPPPGLQRVYPRETAMSEGRRYCHEAETTASRRRVRIARSDLVHRRSTRAY